MTRIDRIDSKGNIRQHALQTPSRTLCGLEIEPLLSQPPSNAMCRRCEIFEAGLLARVRELGEPDVSSDAPATWPSIVLDVLSTRAEAAPKEAVAFAEAILDVLSEYGWHAESDI